MLSEGCRKASVWRRFSVGPTQTPIFCPLAPNVGPWERAAGAKLRFEGGSPQKNPDATVRFSPVEDSIGLWQHPGQINNNLITQYASTRTKN